jgi:hypothetical protein
MKLDWKIGGFHKGQTDVGSAVKRLETYIVELPAFYKMLSEEHLTLKADSEKWSKKEVLGHLIDSALNNLKRFTEIQFLPPPYIISAYNQDELVKINHYQELPLDHLVELWESLNQQIVYVVKHIPDNKLESPVNPKYDNNEMKTLHWVICDYVAHLEHHLKYLKP